MDGDCCKKAGDFVIDLECGWNHDRNIPSLEFGSVVSAEKSAFSGEGVKIVVDKEVEGKEGKKVSKEKRKKTSHKKAPKPPRPPRGPSLDAADQKLVREISELVMLKRARIERMKALKKMKTDKVSSTGSNWFGMVLTVIFCLVILCQGFSSGGNSTATSHQASVVPAGTDHSLISVQYQPGHANDPAVSHAGSPSLVEQISGLDPPEKSTSLVQ